MRKTIPVLIILFIGVIFLYQNCSKVGFTGVQNAQESEGVDQKCVQGKKLGIWLDDANQTFLGDIVTYSGNISAESNYNYSSASAHPINGPIPIGYELHNFFYEGTDGLMLNFYGNVDSDDESAGSADNQYSLKITTAGNNNADHIVFVDDPNNADDVVTLKQLGAENEYNAKFHYWYNTDGAIIGPFVGEYFEIHVQIVSAGDLQGARFYSANSSSFNLGQSSTLSYIIRYREYEDCN